MDFRNAIDAVATALARLVTRALTVLTAVPCQQLAGGKEEHHGDQPQRYCRSQQAVTCESVSGGIHAYLNSFRVGRIPQTCR